MKILLVVYDNGSHLSVFPLGIGYIASVLRNNGHEVAIYNQDIYHYPEEHLTARLDDEKFDVIGLSAIGGYYQYSKVKQISEAINRSKQRPFYILGGHFAAPCPEFAFKRTDADIIVLGEGEETVLDILDRMQNNDTFAGVKGVAYKNESGNVIINEKRELIQDLDSIAPPAWDLFPMDHYTLLQPPRSESTDRAMIVLSSRGCTFKCNFCYRMDKGYRFRSAENIIEEIDRLMKDYKVNYISFYDELFMNSTSRVVEVCEAFIKSKLKFKWNCNGRLNYAKPDVLKLMAETGCVFINYGIEAFDDQILRNMNKALTTKQIVAGVENTLASGISPGLNIIFGNIGESRDTLKKGVDFLLKYDDHAQRRTIRPVTPYPGSPLYYNAIEQGLLTGCEDFYDNKHVNSDLLAVNFTDLTDDEFHASLFEANNRLLRAYYDAACTSSLTAARNLYFKGDTSFRGFRHG